MAENPEKYATRGEHDDDFSSNYAGSEPSNRRAVSSIQELAEPCSGHFPAISANASEASVNRPNSTRTRSSRTTAPAESNATEFHFVDASADTSDTEHTANGSDPRLNGRSRRRESSHIHKVSGTSSEPKASVRTGTSDDSDISKNDDRDRASTVISQQAGESSIDDMGMDRRAFLAEAKRMGAKRSFEIRKDPVDRFSSVGSDPKARLFQNRLKVSDANTAKVVAERRMQQEKKSFRLSSEEQTDLVFALELFSSEKEGRRLCEFGDWAERQIHALEVENIADIVNVEKSASNLNMVQGIRINESEGISKDQKSPYDILVESMTLAAPWLEKCQSALAPYASMAEDINNEIIILELQRQNALRLCAQLDELLLAVSFNDEEQAKISNLDSFVLSSDVGEVDYELFHETVQLITKKSADLSRLEALSKMSAVTEIQGMITEKQNNASSALLVVLKTYLSDVYRINSTDQFEFHLNALSRKSSTNPDEEDLTRFLKGARCLSVCGNDSFVDLVDHYVSVSRGWVSDILSSWVLTKESSSLEKRVLDMRVNEFTENLFYICLLEGAQAFRLFTDIFDSLDQDKYISISLILRRQVPDVEFVQEFITPKVEENSGNKACVHLHASHYLERFAEKLGGCNDEQLHEIITNVETRVGISNFPGNNNGNLKPMKSSPSETTLIIEHAKRRERNPKQSLTNVSQEDRIVRECISNFLVVCQELSLSCHELVEKHCGQVISSMAVPQEVDSKDGRAFFFSTIKDAVDLCSDLSSPTFQVVTSSVPAQVSSVKTRSLCERLIAAAMRSTEVASTSGTSSTGTAITADIVKLQCYGYIAAKLGEGERDQYLIHLAHLSSRVRKHVMIRWAEKAVFESILGNLHFDSSKRSTEVYSKFRTAVMDFNAARIAARMKNAIELAMESSMHTCAILPFYMDMISLTKERMEKVLGRARKDKAISDVRPKLLFFSKELLANLRGELKGLQEQLGKASNT